MAIVSNNGGAVSLPADLLKDASTPDTNKDYFEVTITDLNVNTTYPIQFAWVYEDKTVSDYSATYNVITSSTSTPSSISGLTANFRDASNNKTRNLYIRFTHDNSTTANSGVDSYLIRITYNKGQVGSIFKDFYLLGFDKTNTSKVFELSAVDNSFYFGVFRNRFTVEVTPIDNTNNVQGTTVELLSDPYEITLNPPSITATAGVGSYKVNWSNAEADVNKGWSGLIHIEESIGGGAYTGVASGNVKPIVITTSGATAYSARNVRARFSDGGDNFTDYSNIETVTPISADPTDTTPPGVPSVTAGTTTLNTIPVTITEAGSGTKAYRLRYKKSTDTLYTTEIVQSAGASTSYTIGGLEPNKTYNIGAAAFDQANNLSAFSTDINATTQTQIVPPVTNLQRSAISYGLLATWTAPATPPTTISRYKVELYNSSNALLETQYTFSTNASFSGLKASTTYYVKVYAVDIYNVESVATTSTNLTLNANGGTTDGNAPSSSPTPTVTPLFNALEVKWTAISNADPVIYEVHVSTANGFTPAAGTLSLQTDGTFAIVKTLPGSSTSLSYGTTYYVKIIAKDSDGSAAAGTQASAITLQVDNGDLAANSVRANQIQAGTITADKVNSSELLVDKLFTIGGKRATVSSATVSGGNIVYTTSGSHGFTALSLVNVTGLSPAAFNITGLQITAVTTNTFTVTNTVSATGSSTGAGTAVAVGKNAIRIDSSTDGVTNPFKFYSGTGTYANANTPFYLDTNGQFSLTDKLSFSGTALTVNGTINATAGNFSGNMTVNNGTMLIGKGVNPINIPANGQSAGSLDGIYIGTNNYWFSNGFFSVGAAGNTVTWNGNQLSVTGNINASSGSISGNLTLSGSLIAGTVGGARVTISSAGLFAYDGTATPVETTRIVSNASSGAATLVTKSAKLGDTPGWTVDATSIYSNTANNGIKLDSTSPGTITARNGNYYVGIKPRVSADTDWVLWAGQSTDGNGASFRVNANGELTALNASITGAITATSGTFSGNINAQSGNIFGPLTIGGSGASHTITSASGTGSSITYTVGNGNPIRFSVGQTITVAGANTAGFNVTGAIASLTQTTFTINTGGVTGTSAFTNGSATSTSVSSGLVRIGPSSTEAGSFGIYIQGSADYIYGNGNFRLGGGILTGTSNAVSIDLSPTIGGTARSFNLSNMPATDEDGWAGDPTITWQESGNPAGKLVRGRRFIFDSALNATTLPTNPVSGGSTDNGNNNWFNTTTKQGEYLVPNSLGVLIQRPVKAGDILIVQQ